MHDGEPTIRISSPLVPGFGDLVELRLRRQRVADELLGQRGAPRTFGPCLGPPRAIFWLGEAPHRCRWPEIGEPCRPSPPDQPTPGVGLAPVGPRGGAVQLLPAIE